MKSHIQKFAKEKGSTALLSVMIIAAILIIIVVGMSDSSITTSYEYLNYTSDQVAGYAAEACLEETINRVEDDLGFTGASLEMSGATCTSTVTGGSGSKTIDITINYLDYIQNYQGEISLEIDGEAINATLLNWGQI